MNNKKQSGFTLIEMMIVIAIIGIIAAFAYPNYVEQVRKSKRSDAKVALQQVAQRQESFYARSLAYATSLTALGYATDTIDSPEREYRITLLPVATAQTFTLTATPGTSSGQQHDQQCATFSLDQMGRKTAADSNSTNTSRVCWH